MTIKNMLLRRLNKAMVTVITCTNRDHMIDNVFTNFTQQTIKDKELIIILNKNSMDKKRWMDKAKQIENISIFQLPEDVSVGVCQNFAANLAKYDYIAKFDDDDYYSPYYLEEQLKALEKTKADIIGKRDCYYFLEGSQTLLETKFNLENRFVEKVMDSSLMFRKEILSDIQFPDHNRSYDNMFQKLCRAKGYKIFSTSRNNYVINRRKDKATHTWQIRDRILIDMCRNLGKVSNVFEYVSKEC